MSVTFVKWKCLNCDNTFESKEEYLYDEYNEHVLTCHETHDFLEIISKETIGEEEK